MQGYKKRTTIGTLFDTLKHHTYMWRENIIQKKNPVILYICISINLHDSSTKLFQSQLIQTFI